MDDFLVLMIHLGLEITLLSECLLDQQCQITASAYFLSFKK